MRLLAILAALTLFVIGPFAASLAGASAQEMRAAVFDFDFMDSSLEAAPVPRADEVQRLAMVGDVLRRMLSENGVPPVDLAPVRARMDKVGAVSRCNGCDVDMARDLGAALAVTGSVHKISNLILNMTVVIRNAASGDMVRIGHVSIRGNTDESWSRGLSYLVRNRLLDPPLRLPP